MLKRFNSRQPSDISGTAVPDISYRELGGAISPSTYGSIGPLYGDVSKAAWKYVKQHILDVRARNGGEGAISTLLTNFTASGTNARTMTPMLIRGAMTQAGVTLGDPAKNRYSGMEFFPGIDAVQYQFRGLAGHHAQSAAGAQTSRTVSGAAGTNYHVAYINSPVAPDVVYAFPFNTATAVLKWDANSHVWSTIGNAAAAGRQFYTALIGVDGLIYAFSAATPSIVGVINPNTDTYSEIAGPSWTGAGQVIGGINGPDELFYLLPFNNSNGSNQVIDVYDPRSRTIVNTIALTDNLTNTRRCGILHVDDNIYIPPYGGTKIEKVDTKAGTASTVHNITATLNCLNGIRLMDGTIFMPPTVANQEAYFYRPDANTSGFQLLTGVDMLYSALSPAGVVICGPNSPGTDTLNAFSFRHTNGLQDAAFHVFDVDMFQSPFLQGSTRSI